MPHDLHPNKKTARDVVLVQPFGFNIRVRGNGTKSSWNVERLMIEIQSILRQTHCWTSEQTLKRMNATLPMSSLTLFLPFAHSHAVFQPNGYFIFTAFYYDKMLFRVFLLSISAISPHFFYPCSPFQIYYSFAPFFYEFWPVCIRLLNLHSL